MRNDVVRKKSVEINREQAEQVARLMTLVLGCSYRLGFEGIRASVSDYYHLMPIEVEPMSQAGTFRPEYWMPLSPPTRIEHVRTRSVIRAVFQPQTRWTCTELPLYPSKLLELIRALDDDPAGWGMQPLGEISVITFLANRRIGEFKMIPNNGIGFGKPWSESLEHIVIVWRSLTSRYDHRSGKEKIIAAFRRLNRFLPHLIRLAGGKVEFE